jgi:bifunctional DNase/RNase
VSGPPETPQWCLATVADVRLELPGVHPEVVLEEAAAPGRRLRIPVGFAEGRAIAYAWRRLPTPRPLTHELLAELLDRHGVDVAALRITGRQGATYLAELETEGPRGRHSVSCRPSDGIALVLRRRMHTPLLVAEGLFQPADAQPAGAQGPEAPVPSPPAPPAGEAPSPG